MNGLSLDESTSILHKTFQFCSLEKLPSFAVYDVFKESNIEEDIKNFKAHIESNF